MQASNSAVNTAGSTDPVASNTTRVPTEANQPAAQVKQPFLSSPAGKAIIIFVLLGVIILAIVLAAKKLNPESNTNVSPTLAATQTPVITVTPGVITTPGTTSAADPYSGWQDYTNNDYRVSFKAPANYTVIQKDTPLLKDECVLNDTSYKEIIIKNGDKTILASYITHLGWNPMDCEVAGSPGAGPELKACIKIFETTVNNHTYTLKEEPNLNMNIQFMKIRLTPGSNSILTEEINTCTGGSFMSMESSTAESKFTREEFDNAVMILESIKGL